jgi:hypothetical protein
VDESALVETTVFAGFFRSRESDGLFGSQKPVQTPVQGGIEKPMKTASFFTAGNRGFSYKYLEVTEVAQDYLVHLQSSGRLPFEELCNELIKFHYSQATL